MLPQLESAKFGRSQIELGNEDLQRDFAAHNAGVSCDAIDRRELKSTPPIRVLSF